MQTVSATAPPHKPIASLNITNQRVPTVDVLRGLIMVIMALDHVRDYFGPTPFRPEDVSQTTVGLFFTRWITHICAPLFLLLSGASAYLYCCKHGRKSTTRFLATRGLWLIFLELVVFSFILQWSYAMSLLSIIWAIGWSMLFLAAALWLPRWLLAAIAVGIIAVHNLLPTFSPGNIVPALLHNSPFLLMAGKQPVLVAYTIFPWAAVMMLGYAIGPALASDTGANQKRWLVTGLVMLAAFMLIRVTNLYGDPAPWSTQARGGLYTTLSFINVSKYPPSLLFLLLTLGIGSILWWAFSGKQNRLTAFLQVYGRVPFFYFLLHFSIASAGAYLWTRLAFGQSVNLSFTNPADWPTAYHFSLWRVYAVWLVVVLLLYYPCQWFGNYKRKHPTWWVSYL
ncbi:MAG TPA: heparan-alpha-glucosaminide N-acetyltransferase domain-containing protein [Flavisolibacter sp.]|nr:heparan-alpha-glucosaminide N-acetyltransferase domain-containing protein [Flavisolibacter sp.]